MKTYLFIFFMGCYSLNATAQGKRFTKNGQISFFSKAPVENIEARNNQVLSVWNTTTGSMEFSVLVKGFQFEKALMQEHFNADYMESDRFPKASFAGKLTSASSINFTVNKTYEVLITGNLTLHGVTKNVTIPATVTVNNSTVSAMAAFKILLADYNIKIPAIVKNNISKEILINVYIPEYKPLP